MNQLTLPHARVCVRCQVTKDAADFYPSLVHKDGLRGLCKKCHNADSTKWRKKNPEKHKKLQRVSNLRKNFGLEQVDYDLMLTYQAGVCAICFGKCPTGRPLAVDHDHETGEIRGLLCHHCNNGLGHFKDSPRLLGRASEYLQSARRAND